MHLALQILVSFTKIGSLSWGGGPGMVPMMQAEVVGQRGWMTDEQFLDALAAGNALPGPIMTKLAVWIGWEQGGWLGVAAALVGMVVPSALMVGVLLALFSSFRDNPRVAGMMQAVRPVVLAMVGWMIVEVLPVAVPSWHTAALAVVAAALLFLHVHPAWIVMAAAAFGAIVYAPA